MMVFEVKICVDDQETLFDDSVLKCPDDVDEWARDITVEIWTVTEKIFFEKRFEKPV